MNGLALWFLIRSFDVRFFFLSSDSYIYIFNFKHNIKNAGENGMLTIKSSVCCKFNWFQSKKYKSCCKNVRFYFASPRQLMSIDRWHVIVSAFFVRYQEFPHRPWQWHHTLRANVVIQSVESNRFTTPWTKTNSNAVTTDFVSPIFVSQSSSNKINQNMYALLFWFFILFSHFVIVQRSVANKFVCQYDSCSASYWFNIYIISIQKDLFFGLVLVAIVSVVVVIKPSHSLRAK